MPAPCRPFLQQGAPELAPAARAASTGEPYPASAHWRLTSPREAKRPPLRVCVCPNDDKKGQFGRNSEAAEPSQWCSSPLMEIRISKRYTSPGSLRSRSQLTCQCGGCSQAETEVIQATNLL